MLHVKRNHNEVFFEDLANPIVHEIDTRQNTTLTVFDGSREDESKLAKQFWNSVLLMPPVESTLVCKEIRQRTKNRPVHESADPTKLTASMIKAQQEKALRDKEYEEVAVIKAAADEAKRMEVLRERHEQLRQLFFRQARTNRLKVSFFSIDRSPSAFDVRFSIRSGPFHISTIIRWLGILAGPWITIAKKLTKTFKVMTITIGNWCSHYPIDSLSFSLHLISSPVTNA